MRGHYFSRYPIQKLERPLHPDWEKPRPADASPGAALRRSVFERDKGTCYLCGGPGSEIDHVKPWARGGETTDENLRVICHRCHEIKTAKQNTKLLPIDEWWAYIERLHAEAKQSRQLVLAL